MNGRIRIYRGNRPSKAARKLGKALGRRVLARKNSPYRPRDGDAIVNWGATSSPAWATTTRRRFRWLNEPARVRDAVYKVRAFELLTASGVNTVEYTTERTVAQSWLDGGERVVCRRLTRASGGRGITVVSGGRVPWAPLYSKYFKGRDEYRIHVAGGRVFDQQMKRLRRNTNARNRETTVRNLASGWVFCREGVHAPEIATRAAIDSVRALGLDFGAVDIKCNRQGTRCAVLEVNTAPGLQGTTLRRYSQAIRGLLSAERVA